MNRSEPGAALIGNDVVDLADREALPSPRTSRFDMRVFSEVERHRIEHSGDPILERWSLWAAKEAGYKLLRKLESDAIFSPSRIEVDFAAAPGFSPNSGDPIRVPARSGIVTARGHRFDCRIIAGEAFVHALCTPFARRAPERFGHALLGTEAPDRGTPQGLSRGVRELACTEIARSLGLNPESLRIEKSDGIPHFWLGGDRLAIDLSLSHHGRVVAYACRFFPESMPREAACKSVTGSGH